MEDGWTQDKAAYCWPQNKVLIRSHANTAGVFDISIVSKTTRTIPQDKNEDGQFYIANNRLIGDNILRKGEDLNIDKGRDGETVEYPAGYEGWTEANLFYGSGTEHRPIDIGGDENLIVNNTIEGVYGGHNDNAGEGILNQATSHGAVFDFPADVTHNSIKPKNRVLTEKTKRHSNYVIVISGPGIGQVRRVVGYSDKSYILLDKDWDVLPTTESVFAMDMEICARNIWADNTFSAG